MRSWTTYRLWPIGCTAALLALAGCQTGSAFRNPVARMNPDMAEIVTTYAASGAQPVSFLTPDQARVQPRLDDAVHAVVQAKTGRPFSEPIFVNTTDMTVPGAAGPLTARLYDATPGHPSEPLVLYFPGGGWVDANLDTSDAAARALATGAHTLVLSVAPRRAPEARFPAPQDDAIAAYRWVLDNAPSIGADPRRIAIAGEDSGAILAIDTAMAARDQALKPPVHELLVEPALATDLRTRSAIANRRTIPLRRDDVAWDVGYLVSGPDDLADPRLDLLGVADLHGLPPTTVISSEMDPLESDGTALTQKLQANGVDVTRTEFAGTAHGFFGMAAAVARAKEADDLAANALSITFQQIGDPPPPERQRERNRRHRRHVGGGATPSREQESPT